MATTATFPVLPALMAPYGKGKISHPIFGTFDYDVKPDQWKNVDTDILIKPVWSGSKTLTSAANTLWFGNIKDVIAEERWNQNLAMTISQLRLLNSIYTNPVDPSIGYVQWFPNYSNNNVYNVIPVDLTVADNDGIVLDDIVNAKNEHGLDDGWVTGPVILKLRLVAKVN